MDQPSSGQNVHPHVDQPSSGVPSRAPGSQPTWNESFSQLDSFADQLRVKLPEAPPGLLNFYMSWVPWLAIVFGVLGILISLVALVGSTILGPLLVLFGSPGTGLGLLIGSLFSLAGAALELIGGWLMLQRKATGWWLFALSLAVGLLTSLFRVSIVGLIILVLIAYVHLQVKPNYREA